MFIVDQKISIEHNGKKTTGVLRGWSEKKRYLLLELELANELKYILKPGTEFIFRFQRKGSLYGITGHLVAYLKKTNLWAFTFSEDFMENNMRSSKRIECIVPTSVTDEEGKVVEDGFMDDISLSGAKFITSSELSISEGDLVILNFSVGAFGLIEKQYLQAVRAFQKGQNFIYAGPFYNMESENKKKLNNLIELYSGVIIAQSTS